MTDLKGNTFFEGPAGRIEALLKEPAGAVTRAAIVCHPHPLFGGTMHNKVVYRIAKTFQEAGFAALRFNFRGVGHSAGEHDHGRGEQDDLRAAVQFVKARYGGAELWVGGFSFGSTVMLRSMCADERAAALVAAGVPVSKIDFGMAFDCAKPKLFVQGANDEHGSVADLEKFYARLSDPKHLQVVADADHFFEGHLDKLGQAVADFIEQYS